MSVDSISRTPGPAYVPPADAHELFSRDRDWVYALVRKNLPGFRPQDMEDVAADIMEKLVTRNVPGMYRDDVISQHTGKPVTWRAFLSRQVMLYIRGKREEYGRRRGREVQMVDTPVGSGSMTWGEVFGPSTLDEYPGLAEGDYERLRNWLAMQPPAPGQLSLLELYDELYEEACNGQTPTRAAVARRHGIDVGMAKRAIEALREALEALPSAPEPPRFTVGGVSLSVLQVKSALDALRASKGNRVAPCLQAVSSPLGRLGTREYIALGKAEIRAYPECRKPKDEGKAHGSGTKAAIEHLLERLLHGTGAAVPEVEEPLAPMELLEARLWHIPGLRTDQVDAIKDAVLAVYAPS